MTDHLKKELEYCTDMAKREECTLALKRIDEIAATYPMEPEVWAARGFINAWKNDYAEAISDLTNAVRLCDREPEYFFTRGRYFIQDAKYREAEKDFTRVIELSDYYNSNYYRELSYFFRADARVRVGDFDAAEKDLQHVRDDMKIWTDSLRSKDDVLHDIKRGKTKQTGGK